MTAKAKKRRAAPSPLPEAPLPHRRPPTSYEAAEWLEIYRQYYANRLQTYGLLQEIDRLKRQVDNLHEMRAVDAKRSHEELVKCQERHYAELNIHRNECDRATEALRKLTYAVRSKAPQLAVALGMTPLKRKQAKKPQ